MREKIAAGMRAKHQPHGAKTTERDRCIALMQTCHDREGRHVRALRPGISLAARRNARPGWIRSVSTAPPQSLSRRRKQQHAPPLVLITRLCHLVPVAHHAAAPCAIPTTPFGYGRRRPSRSRRRARPAALGYGATIIPPRTRVRERSRPSSGLHSPYRGAVASTAQHRRSCRGTVVL